MLLKLNNKINKSKKEIINIKRKSINSNLCIKHLLKKLINHELINKTKYLNASFYDIILFYFIIIFIFISV